jgi:propanol-preferring alcohol dehydrogenase
MRAMVLNQPAAIESSPLALEDIPRPTPRDGEILVHVEACAICRTDLHVVEGELPLVKPRIAPGHQVVGTVEAIGPGTKRFKIGDRVGIAWLRYTCGKCRYCTSGSENLCPNARFTGYHEDGGYAEYAVVLEDFAYAIPAALESATATPLLCAGIIGYRALHRAEVKPHSRVGLFGFGSSAHIAIQAALYWGCRVYVMTRDQRHRDLAKKLGAQWTGGADEPPPDPLDSAILFAPVGTLVPRALEALDMGGTLAIAGIYLTDIPALNYERHMFHEKNLRSVTANTRRDGEELLELATRVPLRPQITEFKLEDANIALQKLKYDGIEGSGVLIP